MAFRAALSGVDRERGICRVVISVGDICVRSCPQSYLNILGDLQINRQLLEKRTLATFFFGDEPVLNVDYDNDNVATVYVGQNTGSGSKWIIGSFLIKDGLTSLDKVIDDLLAEFNISENDIQLVAQQMEYDRSLGVYDIYTKR